VGLRLTGLSSGAAQSDLIGLLAEAVVRSSVQLVVVAVDHDLAFAPRALLKLVPQRGDRLACAPQSTNSETEIAGDG
jgi:hypothetical protein